MCILFVYILLVEVDCDMIKRMVWCLALTRLTIGGSVVDPLPFCQCKSPP